MNFLETAAAKDFYYKDVLEHYGMDTVSSAGFLEESRTQEFIDHFQCWFRAPVEKIKQNIASSILENRKPFCVLLNTGAYSPIHIGHIEMMEAAKEKLSENYNVVGGYFSPAHDSYVDTKYEGTAKLKAEYRIALAEEAVADSDWLYVSAWAARYLKQDINFTTIMTQLKNYLREVTGVDIEVAYVFGSDNTDFMKVFVEKGIGVCCNRSGYEDKFAHIQTDCLLKDSKRHFYVSATGNAISSKAIRNGEMNYLPKKIKNSYLMYKNNNFPVAVETYLVRDDSEYAASIFPNVSKESLTEFVSSLAYTIENSFDEMNIVFLDPKQQEILANEIKFPVINLDTCTQVEDQQTLGISRKFALYDGQVYSPELVERPYVCESIEKQIANIKPGSYVLVDDDIASGRTVRMIKSMLPKNVEIEECVALSELSFNAQNKNKIPYEFHDIVDVRDFLVGSKNGGLVVETENGLGRAPYMWPYISPTHRAKIPCDKQLEFSLRVWGANVCFFNEANEGKLTIGDMDTAFVKFATSLKFPPEMLMTRFCGIHFRVLSKLFNEY